VLAAVPIFIFMGYITEQAGLMERLFRVLQLEWPRPRLAHIAVILTATVFAMATGIVGRR
jgi:TRAP-type mannitol/chloroaromatic compound transport system permease large subunit